MQQVFDGIGACVSLFPEDTLKKSHASPGPAVARLKLITRCAESTIYEPGPALTPRLHDQMSLILQQLHTHYKDLTLKQASAVLTKPDQHLDGIL